MASQKKPPIVTILGHVDHGKTTLLEYLLGQYGPKAFRGNLTSREAGGITQVVRAFEIVIPDGQNEPRPMTFIDTPGHEAFTRLRDRGAQIADLALLIVAADEGVKPQTKESIDLLQAYQIPFIVVLNKSDKPHAEPQKVRQQLSEAGVMVEDWGGSVPVVEISALRGEHISDLLEIIFLVSDLREQTCQIDQPAKGYILESIKDPRKGVLAVALIQDGQLQVGDLMVTASQQAKIRSLETTFGQKVNRAQVAMPIIISGFTNLPSAGEQFQLASEATAIDIQTQLEKHESIFRQRIIQPASETAPTTGDPQTINLVLRTDHIGSLEAFEKILEKLASEHGVRLAILRADLGPITPEDIKMAKGSEAIIISFNVRNQKEVIDHLQQANLAFLESDIIYDLEERLANYLKERQKFGSIKAELEVKAIFNTKASKKTIGGEVVFGTLRDRSKVTIMRAGEVSGRGRITSLQQGKDEVDSIEAGKLGGLVVETEVEILVGDHIVSA